MHSDCEIVTDALEDVTAAKSSGDTARGRAKKGNLSNPPAKWRRSSRFGGLLRKLPDAMARRVGYEWRADEACYKSMGRRMRCSGCWTTSPALWYATSPRRTYSGATRCPFLPVPFSWSKKSPTRSPPIPFSGCRRAGRRHAGGKRSDTICGKDTSIRKRHADTTRTSASLAPLKTA